MKLNVLAANLNRIERYLGKQEAVLATQTLEWFDKLSTDEQKEYLKAHPASKLKPGATKPAKKHDYKGKIQKITKPQNKIEVPKPKAGKEMKSISKNLVKIESYLEAAETELAASKVTLSKSQLKVLNETLMGMCLKIFIQKPLTAKFVIFMFWQKLGEQIKLPTNPKTIGQASLRLFLKRLKDMQKEGKEPHWQTVKASVTEASGNKQLVMSAYEKRIKYMEDVRSDNMTRLQERQEEYNQAEPGSQARTDLKEKIRNITEHLKDLKVIIDGLKKAQKKSKSSIVEASQSNKRLQYLENTKKNLEATIKDMKQELLEENELTSEEHKELVGMLQDFEKKLDKLKYMISHFEERVE